MKKEYLEPWKRNYPTKNELLLAWSDWFESKSDEWELFTLTVVFKSGGKIPRPEKWEGEYKNNVLMKIRKRLEPSIFTAKKFVDQKTQQNRDQQRDTINVIPLEEFNYYEFDESSIHRITGNRKPHHIHALIPIKKSQVSRFWSSDTNNLQPRIEKDVLSIKTVQSLLIEKMEPQSTINWIRYILKAKQI
jgi:hypothetical protein